MTMSMKLADRVNNLGTETAFLVASQAAAYAAAGNRVFPFHLGDLNLPTPPNIIEAAYRAMKDGRTGYTPNGGLPQLRELLAEDFNRTRGTSFVSDNVAVQPGGKPVISKFLLTLMNPGDEVLYPNPGFPIYESQIEFHGGVAVPYGTIPGDSNFTFDLDGLESAITDRTKILIINDLHNPTSAECRPEDRRKLAELAVKYDLMVLLDEAYFDVRYDGKSASIISEPGMIERSVVLYTFSKRFAMTGWRLGAAFGPKQIIEVIVKLNVNDESCTNHFVQYAALEAMTGDQAEVLHILHVLRKRRDLCVDMLNDMEGVFCYRPNATFYLYPDVTEAMKNKGFSEYQDFLQSVLEHTGVSMCARVHFGSPLPGETARYVRLAYSGIGVSDIEEGLGRLKSYFSI
jgi:aspartate/methionine/tyrosine aminotransferase